MAGGTHLLTRHLVRSAAGEAGVGLAREAKET
jgi:hypothetical protein